MCKTCGTTGTTIDLKGKGERRKPFPFFVLPIFSLLLFRGKIRRDRAGGRLNAVLKSGFYRWSVAFWREIRYIGGEVRP